MTKFLSVKNISISKATFPTQKNISIPEPLKFMDKNFWLLNCMVCEWSFTKEVQPNIWQFSIRISSFHPNLTLKWFVDLSKDKITPPSFSFHSHIHILSSYSILFAQSPWTFHRKKKKERIERREKANDPSQVILCGVYHFVEGDYRGWVTSWNLASLLSSTFISFLESPTNIVSCIMQIIFRTWLSVISKTAFWNLAFNKCSLLLTSEFNNSSKEN